MENYAFKQNEKCRYEESSESPYHHFCYVNLPSSCTDARNSEVYFGLKLSEKACIGVLRSTPFGLITSIVILALLFATLFFTFIRKIRSKDVRFRAKHDRIMNYFEGNLDMFDINKDTKDQVDFIPYNSKREIPISGFTVGDILGTGNFGRVHKGYINKKYGSKLSKRKVAIKTISGYCGNEEIQNFLYEIKIMNYVKPHLNLVSMIASCTSDFESSGGLWLLIEFCQYGDLQNYIVEHKNHILSSMDSKRFDSRCVVKLH